MASIIQQPGHSGSPASRLYAPLPFTILVDSAEQQPWRFTGMRSDANHQHREYLIEPRDESNPDGKLAWVSLGRHPDSYGDYSVEGYVKQIAIERKSIDDCIGTVCGWGERRERFRKELENLEKVNLYAKAACVIVEGSFRETIAAVQATPQKSQQENRNAFHRSIISFQQDYAVPWFFCDSRRFAEVTAFRFLEKAWRKLNK